MVKVLAEAERPYLYVGAGALASGATDELVELAELLTLPVATTLNAKGVFPENHPLALGIGGFGRATYSTLQAERFAADCDVAIAIGCGFERVRDEGSDAGRRQAAPGRRRRRSAQQPVPDRRGRSSAMPRRCFGQTVDVVRDLLPAEPARPSART